MRDLTSALRDNSVWDERQLSEAPAPKTTNMLRAFAERTKAEDAAAGPIVARLIAAPAMIQLHPEWRTAGVVRKLLAVVDEKNYSEPKVAAEIAALAVEVAESIEPGLYPFDTVMKLRALAWRERAYALYFIGSFADSLDALDHTDQLLTKCAVSAYEAANAAVTRAHVYGEMERLGEAISLADSAAEVFRSFGDQARECVAGFTKANLLVQARRFSEALPIYESINSDSRIVESTRALALYHAALCYRELSRFERAKALFAEALTRFERSGVPSLRAKALWSLGSVFALEHRHNDALALFAQARQEFEELAMAQDLALASVDTAESLLMLGRREEVITLCHEAMEYFAKAGLAYTQGALTALAYLKEAADTQTLTRTAFGEVRAFFQMLPKRPELLFAYSA
ncbi:MAG: tetratricopeptide repeat protein [Acidobacteriota bacterium]|nr:tetratricopeptide repeat protein [Acidobacteriota bacterium]